MSATTESMMPNPGQIVEFLNGEALKYPELKDSYEQLSELHDGKLWHQLTDALVSMVSKPESSIGRNLIDLYENFLKKFETKINQLKLVQIVSVIAKQYVPSRPLIEEEVNVAISFLESIVAKKKQLGEEACLVAQMITAGLLVQYGTAESLDRVHVMLDEAQPLLNSLDGSGAETFINSSFYGVACEYYKVVGPPDEYYRSCIQFLAYTPVDTMSAESQHRFAVDMSLAALVSKNLFNYGEVLAQPILSVLDGTPDFWLHDMISIFNSGSIDAFGELCITSATAINAQPVILQNFEMLKQKLALLALMQLVFERPPDNRLLTLKEVADVTKLEIDQAEWLLMNAMSKGLIKGKIDQVEQVVSITWLKPRVLNAMQQIKLKDKLAVWKQKVDKTLFYLEQESPDLFHSHA